MARKAIVFFILMLFVPSVLAEVVVFSKYDTDLTIDNGFLHIQRNMRLKNVGANPIIPGELHFKMRQESTDGVFAPNLDNVKAMNSFGASLTTTVIQGNSETDLVISAWDPLLPGFHYDLNVSYDLAFDPKGLLFYEILVPTEETTIPIISQKTNFHLPSKYHVTFAPNATVSKTAEDVLVSWKNIDVFDFEYSKLPLPKMGFKAVNVFWIILMVLLVSMFFVVWIRRR